jgi:hypothetical protein
MIKRVLNSSSIHRGIVAFFWRASEDRPVVVTLCWRGNEQLAAKLHTTWANYPLWRVLHTRLMWAWRVAT